MDKKALENFWIVIIIAVFLTIGYYTYKSYEYKKNSDDNNIEINNFYNVDYLFNNSYIDVPKTIDDFSLKDGKIYIYLDASNIMYIKYTANGSKNKRILGLPNESITIYYNKLNNDYYEFLGKTENGDIYYSYVDINSTTDDQYTLIGNRISKVYIPLYDKNGVYVNKKNKFNSNFLLYDNDEKFKYIDVEKNGKYTLKNDIYSKKPYFDYICASENPYICNKLMIYITFNNELVYNDEKLKDNNKNIIHVKDIFSSFEINSKKNVDINNLTQKEMEQYKYLFSSYIIDDNQIIYQYDISNNNKKIIALNDETNKVKEYVYESNSKLTIIFEDGTSKTITAGINKVLTTSTIYDKKQNNNEKVLIQP